MFNDRDLAVIGSGAVLSIFCLLLPVSFAWKIVIGLGVLVLSMVLALLRLGTDRLTLEAWLKRRTRYYLRPKFWTFHERKLLGNRPRKDFVNRKSEPQSEPLPPEQPRALVSLQKVSGEKLTPIFLALVGVYFLYGLLSGDAVDIASVLKGVLP